MAQQQGPVNFIRPPDAPVYYPTEEEFLSPLLYIQTIKAEAEKFGICKIVPPKSFKPPFAVNKETFKFKARYQRLCDLDGFSRSRHSFSCMLRRFWTDQGWPSELVPQTVGDKVIDWYDLYIAVYRLGGYKNVCSTTDGWTHVARCLAIPYASYPNAMKELKSHYEKNLLPYDEFRSSVESYLGKDAADASRTAPVNKSAGCRRMPKESENAVAAGAGSTASCKPTTPVNNIVNGGANAVSKEGSASPDGKKTRMRRSTSNVCYSEVVCEVCKETDDFDNLKFCEKCETTYHLRCIPASIRKDKAKLWLCPKCMKETYDGLRSCHTFGFDNTLTPYTLDEFQKKANEFKRIHFGSANVGLHVVEQEFWRLLGDPHGETVVEYGADLHRGELGSSGFPTEKDRSFLRESEKEYIDHPWNLNKLPDNELSILRHITVQISGMKVPWMYVGMVFSAFCWHTEDHWSASINFLHLGEPKTWYGVPGSYADAFETAFKQLVPILTESNADLLHQLVTHMNPTVLQACGIPVYRVDQRAGEFIVTFPRAYHAGFNQGFNFAEAVNFCLADWIPHGRLSVNHYSNCKRDLVFSHDELICCMADQANLLHQTIAKACHKDFLQMVSEESSNRQVLIEKGIVLDDEPTLFEFMDDHERACFTCHTTLFLSAVQCACSNEKLSCGKHADELCHCGMESRRLLYRYTIDDLNLLLDKLLKRTEMADEKSALGTVNGAAAAKRPISHGQDGRFATKKQKVATDPAPMDFFGDYEASGNSELKAVMKMANELVSPQTITRGRDAGDGAPVVKRWKNTDVEGLVTSLMAFPGTGKEVTLVKEYLRKYYALQTEIRMIMQTKPEEQLAEFVRRVYDQARSTNIDIPELSELQLIVQQTEFRERICVAINDSRSSIQTLAEILQTADEIFIRTPYMEQLITSITTLIDEGRNIEIDIENVVTHGVKISLIDAKILVERADAYPIELKNVDSIREGIETIEKLTDAIKRRRSLNQRLHMQEIKDILGTGPVVNFHSGSVGVILEIYAKAHQFLEKAQTLFFGNSDYVATGSQHTTLLDVLCPRRVYQPRVTQKDDEKGAGEQKAPEEIKTEDQPGSSSESGISVQPQKTEVTKPAGKVMKGHHPFDLDLDEDYNMTELAELFEQACWDEELFYEELRESNCLKSAIDSDTRDQSAHLRGELRWCICGGQQLGPMIQCDSCFDWFHVSCTRMAEFVYDDGIGEYGLVRQLIESIQFMCDICQRGVRPPLEMLRKLYSEYKDVQRFICVPEIDLAALVINRAEKWRKSATNVILELPSIINRINTVCIHDVSVMDRLRRRVRDGTLAILLEGNLLEVKVTEWLFLYDFVHENFRKGRADGAHSSVEPAKKVILPARTHGLFPIAVDMISPLFRKLSRLCRPPAIVTASVVERAEHLNQTSNARKKGSKNGKSTKGGARNRPGRKRAADVIVNAPSPTPEPEEIISSQIKPRNATSFMPKMYGERIVATPYSVNSSQRLGRKQFSITSSGYETNDLEDEDNATETCIVCKLAFPADTLPSTILDGRIVPMCTSCKDSITPRGKSSSGSVSDADSGHHPSRKKYLPNNRRRRAKPQFD